MAIIAGHVSPETAGPGSDFGFDTELQRGYSSEELNRLLFSAEPAVAYPDGEVVMEGPFANWTASSLRTNHGKVRPLNHRGVTDIRVTVTHREIVIDQREEPPHTPFTHPRSLSLRRAAGSLAVTNAHFV